jgi:hypothetical protein
MHLSLAVAAKAHAHVVPSRVAGAELRSGLWTAAGLVASPVTGHAHVEVCGRLGLDEEIKTLNISVSRLQRKACPMRTYICCIPLIKCSQRRDWAWRDEPSLVGTGGQEAPTLNHKC